MCTSSLEVESTTHFFLHCHHFSAICIILNNSLKALDKHILKLSDSFLTKVILNGDSKYRDIQNHDIVNSTISYILDSKCFGCSLIQCNAPLFIYSKMHVIFVRNIPNMLSLWVIFRQRGTKFSILSPILSDFDQILLICSYL